nr:hypothetical protein [Patescibacteria group bacterium]
VITRDSLLSTLASSITIGVGGYKYFVDQTNLINQNLFISSIVCIGISYLLNLIIMFITLPTLIAKSKTNKDIFNRMNNKININNYIKFSIDFKFCIM